MSEFERADTTFDNQSLPTLQWLGDQVPGGFLVYRDDGDQEILSVNQEALRIFGCSSLDEFKELTGYTFRGIVHPDDYDSVQASITAQIADADNNNFDFVKYRIVRKDGSVRWVDDYGHFTQVSGYGDVYYVFITDITETHLLAEENARRAEVIEGLSREFVSFYHLDLSSGAITPYRLSKEYFQKIVAELAAQGQSEPDFHEVLSLYAERYVLEEDREHFIQEIDPKRIAERLTNEQSYTVSYRRWGEGEGAAGSAGAIGSAAGSAGGTAGGSAAGSAGAIGSAALNSQRSSEPLFTEMLVARISKAANHAVMGFRDVTEQTLRVQREMADRLHIEMELEREKHANEVKSSFLFNISHDIRTPMNAIMGFADLAQRNIDKPERLADYLDKINESSHQLMALIDDVLEMSRIDYGRIEIKSEPVSLREQLEQVIDMFRAPIEEKRLTLKENVELPEREVLVDAHRFRRIMGNLVSNAVKFTPEGGSIEIGARQKQISDSGYARFEFTVSDTGIGMTEDFMRRMYETFEREESSTKAGTIGTGLGLSITKNLLNMMGGSIAVKSAKGSGSTFTVDLPLKFADHASDVNSAEVVTEIDHRAEGEYRILLVEDIEINRLLAETVLEDAGFMVESVPDGCDAVEAIQNHPLYYYDLVLMDIQMPVMNGYEATRSIRALNRKDTANLPIVALSANAREEDKRMSLESGMDNHVAKPFDVAHLISTVNAHIAARNKE